MTKIISVFNNKGGVGKSTICWNIGDALGRIDKKVLLIDFDPQCNLSIAMLGEGKFVEKLPTQNIPYGSTIRSFLQRFLQSTGGEEIFLHKGKNTHQDVDLIAGDFWLNVYADTLNVGSDLLAGTGLSRYVSIRKIVDAAKRVSGTDYDFVLIDLPPSFGSLVRAAFYSSDYYITPCTSDSFSVYCVGLMGQMVPSFVRDWQSGHARFLETNPHYNDFNNLGRPVFAGWVFNGFDTARIRRTKEEIEAGVDQKEKAMNQADETMCRRIASAIQDDLVGKLTENIAGYNPVADNLPSDYMIGDIEDANVLMQNSLWLSVPLGQLEYYQQVTTLQDRRNWATNQVDQMRLLQEKFRATAMRICAVCA